MTLNDNTRRYSTFNVSEMVQGRQTYEGRSISNEKNLETVDHEQNCVTVFQHSLLQV